MIGHYYYLYFSAYLFMLPSKERLNPSLLSTKSNECPVSPLHAITSRPYSFLLSLKTVPGVECRPNHVRRVREEDRDEATDKAGGKSLPKS
jgi:hypothetical protein